MGAINRSLEEDFEARYPGTDVQLESSGTETALQRLMAGEIDLVAIGRPLTEAELAQNLKEYTVSREKIAIIVGADNPFQADLTSDQFAQMFRGEITNWQQVGGPDRPIRFIDRPAGSDIRRSLSDYQLFKSQPFETGDNAVQLETDDTAAVVRALGDDGISYAIASEVLGQQNVRVLTMHGTSPDNQLYPYSQPRGYVYRGEASIPVEAFLGFATSPEGQQAVAEAKEAESDSVATADILPGVITASPDGQTLVRGKANGQLEWLNRQGQPTGFSVDAHDGLVTGLSYTPDGQTLISAGADGSIRRWDPQGNPVGPAIQGSDGPITSLTISPDGQTIVTGNNDGTYERWSINGTAMGGPITAHDGPVRAVEFAPDGQMLLTGSTDGVVGLWNPDGSSAGKVPDAHKQGVTALTTSPDGQLIVSGGREGTIQFWDGAGNPQGDPISAHSSAVVDIDFSPDGQTIATLGADGLLKQWSRNGTPIEGATVQLDAPAAALAYNADGNLVAGVPEGDLPVRDATGTAVNPDGDASGEAAPPPFDLPSPVADVFRSIGLVPEETWWIIPAIPLLLVLLGLIWTFFGKKSKPQADGEETLAALEGERDLAATSPDVSDDLETFPAAESEEYTVTPPEAFSEPSTDGSLGAGDDLIPAPGDEAAFMEDEAAFLADADETYPLSESSPPVVEPAPPPATTDSDRLAEAKNYVAEGNRLYREGRYEEALEFFNSANEAAEVQRIKAMTQGTTLAGAAAIMAQAMAGRGNALSALRRFDPAIVSLNRSLELDSGLLSAWVGKGQVLLEQGHLDEALFSFDKALEMAPDSGPAWEGKGKALMQLGHQAEAQNCLQRAAEYGGSQELPVPPATSESAIPPATIGTTPGKAEVLDPDIPEDLQLDVEKLPGDAEVVTAGNLDVPLPPDVAMAERLPAEPELPPSMSNKATGITPGPVPVSMPPADSLNPDEAKLAEPEGLDGVAEMLGGPMGIELPDGRLPLGGISPGPAVTTESVPGSPSQAEPAQSTSTSDTQAKADNPDDPRDMADLPPEVLAALRGIPSDSPDSFDLGSSANAATPVQSLSTNGPETASETDTSAAPTSVQPLSTSAPEVASAAGTSSLTIRPQDERIYAVWTLDDGAREQAKQAGGERLVLRLYDVTEGEPGTLVESQNCYELAKDWYVTPPQKNRFYLAEIGYLGGGNWFPIATSEPIHIS